ncbi:hypothetical protein Meth11DRAFT_0184 [Methylophilaceae bacterium 11]|nr:hypothetical protein Meth11DRAFT_0184 [Methylophilaceae bacterium 11]
MNRIKKNITVRFFSIETKGKLLDSFASAFAANKLNDKSRILNLKLKKHLIKISEEHSVAGISAYAVTVVRERNTWQTKATSDGSITGLALNQGIIGDPYFFFVVPSKKILLGFTTGPSGSLISVGKTMLDQFNSDRLSEVKLDLITKEKDYGLLRDLPTYSKLHFKIQSTSLADITDDAPQMMRNLSAAPYINNNMQLDLELDLNDETRDAFPNEVILELIEFLSDHDGCNFLKVQGVNKNGNAVKLDFGNAFVNFKTEIQTRDQFIDENNATKLLKEALVDYIESQLSV